MEFNCRPEGPIYPNNFTLKNYGQLEYTFPSYTIGEAASATILEADKGSLFQFESSSRAELASLCTVPLPGYKEFFQKELILRPELIGQNGVGGFVSYGRDLHQYAKIEAVKVLSRFPDIQGYKKVFPHASSWKEWDKFATELSIQDKLFHIYPETGNLVSASIPVAMKKAIDMNVIERGDRIIFWVGSAGMSFSATGLTY